MECQESTSLLHGELSSFGASYIFLLHILLINGIFLCRMMSTESANSFTLIGEASDGGTMENLSRRLKVKSTLDTAENVFYLALFFLFHLLFYCEAFCEGRSVGPKL